MAPISLILAVLLVSCNIVNSQFYNNFNYNNPVLRDTTGCLTGQFYDRINNNCYNIPTSCPAGSTVDSTVGCTCPSGQLWNHVRGQCENTNFNYRSYYGNNFNYRNYYDNFNYRNYYDNNFNYNNPVLRDTTGCLTGQFYDRINNNCYNIPTFCPAGSTVDSTVGCTCPSGQLWNHVRGQCDFTFGK